MLSGILSSDRLSPPQNRDAERRVLGSMLRDNIIIHDVVQILQSEKFYFDAHQKIFAAIKEIYDSGSPIDAVILAEKLRRNGTLEDVGGCRYLAELWDAAPTAANAEYYARIIHDEAIIRSLIHSINVILRDAYDHSQPAEELLANAEREILEIAEQGVTGKPATIQDAIREVYTRMDGARRAAFPT